MKKEIKYPCAIDDEAEEFCELIAADMVERFSISKEEAMFRINHHWKGLKMGGPEEIIYHEDADYWSQTIYWNEDAYWWITGEKRKEMKIPPLTPKNIDKNIEQIAP